MTDAAASACSNSIAIESAHASWRAAGMSSSDVSKLNECMRTGRWAEAIKLLTSLLDSSSSSQPHSLSASSLLTPAASDLASLRVQRAECAFRFDEYHAALRDCDRVLAVQPTSVSAASLRVKCLLGLRRYSEAEAEIAELNQRDALQATSHFAPLQQLWQRIQLEREGQYDMAAIAEESLSLTTPSEPCNMDELRRSGMFPCVRLGSHADYLNPAVECAVAIAGKGRGTRVRASSSTAAPAASSSLSSLSPGSLPAHSLVMSMKAISAHLQSDEFTRVGTLMCKLQDQPHLVDQVQRLFGLASPESNRAQLLSETSVEKVWKRLGAAPSTASALCSRESLVDILGCNSFADSLSCAWRELGVGGGGLFFLPSFFNHSCVPNCTWKLVGDQLFIRTIREVAAGDELTITYSPILADNFRTRQAELRTWHFDCHCERCAMDQQYPELQVREKELQARCDELNTAANELSQPRPQVNRATELESLIARLQSLIGTHKDFISVADLSPAQVPIAHLPLLPQLQQLSTMLSRLLSLLSDLGILNAPHFHFLLECHRAVCMERVGGRPMERRDGMADSRHADDADAILRARNDHAAAARAAHDDVHSTIYGEPWTQRHQAAEAGAWRRNRAMRPQAAVRQVLRCNRQRQLSLVIDPRNRSCLITIVQQVSFLLPFQTCDSERLERVNDDAHGVDDAGSASDDASADPTPAEEMLLLIIFCMMEGSFSLRLARAAHRATHMRRQLASARPEIYLRSAGC